MSDVLTTMRPRADQDVIPTTPGDTRPEPSYLEQAGAARRTAKDIDNEVLEGRRGQAYQPLIEALIESGVSREELFEGGGFIPGYEIGDGIDLPNYATVWREALRRGLVSGKREEFERGALRRDGGRDRDLETMARGQGVASTLAQLGGSIEGSMEQPINIVTLPIGGFGKTAAVKIGTEALAGAFGATVGLPGTARAYEKLGEDFGVGDALADVAMGAAGGAAIQGGIELAPVLGRGVRAVDRAAVARAAPVRQRIDRYFAEPEMARALANVPDHLRTPQQQAFIDVETREAEIDASSPFERTIEGDTEHRARLQRARDLIDGSAPRATNRGFDMQRYMRSNRSAESSGSDVADAASSSAFGRYQFLRNTWLRYYRRTFGHTDESERDILAKRANGATQDRVMATFTRDNVRRLQSAGLPVDDGTVYLMHFLGAGDALKVLRARGSEGLRGLVSQSSRAANRAVFKDLRTASDLIAWARRRMGDREGGASRPRAAGDSLVDDALDDGAYDGALADEAQDIEAARARDQAEEAAAGGGEGIAPVAPPATPRLRPEEFADEESWRTAQGREDGELPEPMGPIPKPKGQMSRADDLLAFIARRGGISFDGLDEATRGLVDGPQGHDLKRSGNLDHEVKFVGKILKEDGHSLEAMGEALWEAGYLGPVETTPRPTEGELIELIDRLVRTGEKRYAEGGERGGGGATKAELEEDARQRSEAEREETEDERAAREAAGDLYWARYDQISAAAKARYAADLLPEDTDAIQELMQRGTELMPANPLREGMTEDELAPWIGVHINQKIDDALAIDYLEIEDPHYGFEEADIDGAGEAGPAGIRGDGRAIEPGGARELGEGIEAGAGDAAGIGDSGEAGPSELEDPDSDLSRAFDTDDGEGIKAVSDSAWHDIRAAGEAVPEPDAPKATIERDNPGGDWLERKQRQADKERAEAAGDGEHGIASRGLRGSTTATARNVSLPVAMLRDLEGVAGEKPAPGQVKYDTLSDAVKSEGFKQKGSVMVWVNHHGEPFIYEGNNRVAIAAREGVERLNVEIQWRNGAEATEGPMSEAAVREAVAPKATEAAPAPKVEDAAPEPEPAKAVTPDMDEEAMFAAIRDQPDTDEGQDAIAAMRSQLWADAEAAGTLNETINRFDTARDRWDEQFEASREVESKARMEALRVQRRALAEKIVAAVEAGGTFGTINHVRKQFVKRGKGMVRVGADGTLEVMEGRKWVAAGGGDTLEDIARQLGIKPGEAAPAAPQAGAPELDEPPANPLDLGEQVDPNLAAKQTQELDLAAQQPLLGGRKTGVAQNPTLPEGLFGGAEESALFDAGGQPLVDLEDGKGPRSLADIDAEIQADRAAIDAIKGCLL